MPHDPSKTVAVPIYFPVDLHRWLLARKEADGVPITQQVVKIIQHHRALVQSKESPDG